MAASAIRLTESKNLGTVRRYLMKASTTIYAGTMVMCDANGLAVPAANGGAANTGVVGVATESVTSAGSGSYYVKVVTGLFLFAATSIAQADVGKVMWAKDDQTFDETSAEYDPIAGILVQYVSATSGWISITGEHTSGIRVGPH